MRRLVRGAASAVALAVWLVAADAQIQLPGAAGAARPSRSSHAPRAGADEAGGGSAPRAMAKPIVIAPPSADTILGQTLSHDGSKGLMIFGKVGDGVVLLKLTLTGDKISKPGEACTVDVSMVNPVATRAAGRPAGATRLDVPLGACPFSVDVLEGAVLVSRPSPTCDFTAADCRVAPGGLWGPAASDISQKRIKDLERERVRIETTMRANFRALLKRAGKDRTAVKAIARDQAAFSSDREMLCRDYQNESVHGFCSTQVTEARALAMLTKFGAEPDGTAPVRHEAARLKRRPRPIAKATAPAETPER